MRTIYVVVLLLFVIFYTLNLQTFYQLTMLFDEYALPSPHLAFSHQYFSCLSFSQAAELQYPTIAPPGSVTAQHFTEDVPQSASGTLVTPYEVLPDILDLLSTSTDMESAYLNGMRSVVVDFTVCDVAYIYCYHFSKVP
jgi:hypothetical protein